MSNILIEFYSSFKNDSDSDLKISSNQSKIVWLRYISTKYKKYIKQGKNNRKTILLCNIIVIKHEKRVLKA